MLGKEERTTEEKSGAGNRHVTVFPIITPRLLCGTSVLQFLIGLILAGK